VDDERPGDRIVRDRLSADGYGSGGTDLASLEIFLRRLLLVALLRRGFGLGRMRRVPLRVVGSGRGERRRRSRDQESGKE
jgi:hypothetical protein